MGRLTRFRRPGTASLYAKIGGHDALEVIVEDFYCRVLDDDHLAGFFALPADEVAQCNATLRRLERGLATVDPLGTNPHRKTDVER